MWGVRESSIFQKKKKKSKNTAPINKCKRELGVHKEGTALAKKGLKLQTIFFPFKYSLFNFF